MKPSEASNSVAAVLPDEACHCPAAEGEDERSKPSGRWTSTAAGSPEAMRAVCRDLLDQIPDEGLADLFAALEAIREFYAPPPANPVGEPSVARTRARLRATYQRPDFHLDEE